MSASGKNKTVRVSRDAIRFYFYAEQSLRQRIASGGGGFAGQQISQLDEGTREMYRDEFFRALDPT